MSSEKQEEKKHPSVYRLNLEPGKEQRREQWGLIFISDVELTVDFFHTDMMEKVISIGKVEEETEEKKEKLKEEAVEG